MAAKFDKPIHQIESVGVGKVATVRVETGRRIMKLLLMVQATGQVLNEIVEWVEIVVGGKVQRRFSPDELETEMGLVATGGASTYKAQNNTAGSEIHWPIWFREPWRKGFRAGRALAWNTGDVADDEFVVRVKMLSSAHSSVSLRAAVEYDNPVDKAGNAPAMGQIMKIYQEDIAVTGVRKTFAIPRDRGDLVAFTLHDTDIDKATLVVADIPVRELEETQAKSVLTGDEMTPDNDVFHVALDNDDDTDSAIPLAGKKNANLMLELADGTPRNIRGVFTFLGPRD